MYRRYRLFELTVNKLALKNIDVTSPFRLGKLHPLSNISLNLLENKEIE
jgi:hypothetical protein